MELTWRAQAVNLGRKEGKMDVDFVIYLTQWGYADEMCYACESVKDGMIYSAFRNYREAVEWCESKGYSHKG